MTIEELERLCAAATPGPWRANLHGVHYLRFENDNRNDVLPVCATSNCLGKDSANAAFIAALCNAAPALIALAKEVKAMVEDKTDIGIGRAAWYRERFEKSLEDLNANKV